MDHLWTPWRYSYVQNTVPEEGCLFCRKAADTHDRENFIVFRGERNFALLNLYPYTSGHLLIAPYEHVATLTEAHAETLSEMMQLTQRAEKGIREAYNASGLNIGMNIGHCAGAGVAGHIHMHILPRWPGDVNFMTSVGETRVVPEAIDITYEKLLKIW